MAAPTYIASNGVSADTTSAYSTAPSTGTHQVDDLLISVAMTSGGQLMTLAGTGWSELGTAGGIAGTHRVQFGWKRATATSGEGPTWTSTGSGSQFANVHVVRGAETAITPWDFATFYGDATTQTTTITHPDLTTLGSARLVLVVLGAISTTFPNSIGSGWTNPDESSSASGTGFQTVALIRTEANATTVASATTASWAANHRYGALALAIFEPGNGPKAFPPVRQVTPYYAIKR